MSVKRRFSTRWGHPYHRQGACTECRQTLLYPLCSITPMTPEGYTEYSAQSKREDTTGMAILRALLAGERDPQRLASHRDRRGKHAQATMAKALEGPWRAEHLFALQPAVEQ